MNKNKLKIKCASHFGTDSEKVITIIKFFFFIIFSPSLVETSTIGKVLGTSKHGGCAVYNSTNP